MLFLYFTFLTHSALRFQRPAWTTGVLIPASFLCGIGAAIVIWRGGERTKRVEEVKERLRAALAQKPAPMDDQLPRSLSRNPEPKSNLSTITSNRGNEKADENRGPSTIIEEHMTVPRVSWLNQQ